MRYNGTRELKAVIFDMDNTLFDFEQAQWTACEAVVQLVGGSVEALYSYFLRDPNRFEDHGNIADYIRDRNIYDDETYAEFCKIYDRSKMDAIVPYPGVREVLERLKRKGAKLAVVTNASNGNALARLKKLGWPGSLM